MEDMDIFERFLFWISIILLFFISITIFVPGNQENYYVEMNKHEYGTTYCVYADVNWRIDPKIYCSQNFSEVMMLNFALNTKRVTIQKEVPNTAPETKKTNENFKEESF